MSRRAVLLAQRAFTAIFLPIPRGRVPGKRRAATAEPATAVRLAQPCHGRPSFLSVFSYREYRRYSCAATLVFTAQGMEMLVRGWLVHEMTHSPFLVALVPALMMLPMPGFTLIGGELADRFSRPRADIAGDRLAMVSYAILAALVGTTFLVTNMMSMQLNSDADYRGRVISARFLMFGLAPLGMLAPGALAGETGARTAMSVFAAAGAVLLLLAVLVARPRSAAGAT